MKWKRKMKYQSKVVYDEDTDEYLLEFTDEMLEELGWEEGDTLKWTVADDQVILEKV